MTMDLTAVFLKVPEGYVGFVEELPGANTQGETLEEARSNLQEAIELLLEANRELLGETLEGKEVIREHISITSRSHRTPSASRLQTSPRGGEPQRLCKS